MLESRVFEPVRQCESWNTPKESIGRHPTRPTELLLVSVLVTGANSCYKNDKHNKLITNIPGKIQSPSLILKKNRYHALDHRRSVQRTCRAISKKQRTPSSSSKRRNNHPQSRYFLLACKPLRLNHPFTPMRHKCHTDHWEQRRYPRWMVRMQQRLRRRVTLNCGMATLSRCR